MQSTREAIYQKLFELGCTVADFKLTSRKWKIWNDVEASLQPAFFQVQRKEKAITGERRGIPTKWELHIDWIVYVNTAGDGSIMPSSLMNPITDAIAKLFDMAPLVSNLGLPGVQEARIMDEDIVTDEGTLGDQAAIVIPIRIIAI